MVMLFGCSEQIPQDVPSTISCDAETVIGQGSELAFDCGNWSMSRGGTQSNLDSRSGQYSCLLDSTQRYGFGIIDPSAEPGDIYRVSAWTKGGDGRLVATDKDGGSYYRQSSISDGDSLGWRKLSMVVHIPPYSGQQSFCSYVWNPGKDQCFFDDFQFEKVRADSTESDIQIVLDDRVLEELCAYRDSAKSRGQITSDLKIWLPAIFSTEEFTCDADIRLKGDWVDHILSPKWSLRIKLEPGRLFKGMSQFSIQSPEVRDFMAEWVFHQACQAEDVMTTQYDFANVELNGFPMGLYAVEEHFTMEMPVRMDRQRGPILKFEEDLMFWYLKNGPGKKLTSTLPWMRHAGIKPFGSGALSDNPKLKREFERAQDLLHSFRNVNEPAIQLFKPKQMLAASILTDLYRAHHAARWHNQRFYYDPNEDRLEPVIYDAFVTGGEFDKKRHALAISPPRVMKDLKRLEQDPMDLYGLHIHLDSTAIPLYKEELERICDSSYLTGFEESVRIEYNEKLRDIQLEYPEYNYDLTKLLASAAAMRKSYSGLEWGQRLSVDSLHKFVRFNVSVAEHEHDLVMAQAFYSSDSLTVLNYSEFSISVEWIGTKENNQVRMHSVEIEAFEFNKPAPKITIACSKKAQVVGLKMRDIIAAVEIKPWRAPAVVWPD